MAINFPSTINQPTDGTFAHTDAGITWIWDGTTWKAQGINLSYTLPTASASSLGGVKVGANLAINASGVLSAQSSVNILNDLADVNTTGAANGKILKHDGTSWVIGDDTAGTTINTVNDIGNVTVTNAQSNDYLSWNGSAWVNGQLPSTSGLQSRTTGAATATTLADQASRDLTIATGKTFALHKIQTSHAAWVTLYTDTTSRTNDAARSESTDPLPGTGVIAEVITTGDDIQKITPGVIGWNNDGTPSTNTYVKVVNKSGSQVDLTVTLHFVQIEG